MADSNSFTSHFVELRTRLLNSLIFIFIAFVISYIFADHIYEFLVEPYANAVKNDQISRRLIFTALHETFITYLKGAFFAATINRPGARNASILSEKYIVTRFASETMTLMRRRTFLSSGD